MGAQIDLYIESVRYRPFAWGAHDCLTFQIGAAEVQTRKHYPVPPYRSAKEALRLLRGTDIHATFDAHFQRCKHFPPKGSLVLTPDSSCFRWRGGVVIGARAAYVSPSGLVFDMLRPEAEHYWVVT